jgi:hypothetical protein
MPRGLIENDECGRVLAALRDPRRDLSVPPGTQEGEHQLA